MERGYRQKRARVRTAIDFFFCWQTIVLMSKRVRERCVEHRNCLQYLINKNIDGAVETVANKKHRGKKDSDNPCDHLIPRKGLAQRVGDDYRKHEAYDESVDKEWRARMTSSGPWNEIRKMPKKVVFSDRYGPS
jgi:hypothetical protein